MYKYFLNNLENYIEIYQVEHNILSAYGTIGMNRTKKCTRVVWKLFIK